MAVNTDTKTKHNVGDVITDNYLGHEYTLWCHDQNASKWHNAVTFNTVNQYWACIKSVLDRPRMVSNGMIFIMRDGINPDWSEGDNINGGRISWKLDKNETATCWENIATMLVAGDFDTLFGDYGVNGVSVSPKKNSNIIKLWLAKLVPDDIVKNTTLPPHCIFHDKLMIFRTNVASVATQPVLLHNNLPGNYSSNLPGNISGNPPITFTGRNPVIPH